MTLISTSCFLSAIFPSVCPASASTVLESVCAHASACVFAVHPPVRFQVCELAPRHSVVWRRRPASAGTTGRTARPADQSEDERNFTSWPSHQAKMTPGPLRHLLGASTWPTFPSVCFLWGVARSQVFVSSGVETKATSQDKTRNERLRFKWPEISKCANEIFKTFCLYELSNFWYIYFMLKWCFLFKAT